MTKPSVVARESQHTQLPWAYSRTHGLSTDTWYVLTDSDGRGPIFEVGGKDKPSQIAVAAHLVTDPATIQANAEFIVRACNSHQALVEALQAAVPALEQGKEFQGEVLEVIAQVREALAKAGA